MEIDGALRASFTFAGVTGKDDSDWLYEYAGEVLSIDVVEGLVETKASLEAIGSGESSRE